MAELLCYRFPEDDIQLFSVATATGGRGSRRAQDSAQGPIPHRVAMSPCIGCNRCTKGEGCFMHDDMDDLLEVLAAARELYVVCPVFFAGPPAQMKAILDRVQPLFFTDVRKRPKRPAHLLVVGGGGDPHGFDPLVGIMRSALSVAGFRLDGVEASIGEDLQGALTHAEALLASAGLQ